MLIDFGIARFLPPGGRGTQIGSVGYAPPEQYMGKIEPRSDLYSLAATMHHLLTGRDPQLEPPFSFPPLRALAPEVSVKTADVIMRALEQDVTKRPASAKEMQARAARAAARESVGAIWVGARDSRATSRPMSTQSTVVLNSAPVRAVHRRAARRRGSRRCHPSPPASTMPTIVLSEPVAERIKSGDLTAERPRRPRRSSRPQIKRRSSSTGKARRHDRASVEGARQSSAQRRARPRRRRPGAEAGGGRVVVRIATRLDRRLGAG